MGWNALLINAILTHVLWSTCPCSDPTLLKRHSYSTTEAEKEAHDITARWAMAHMDHPAKPALNYIAIDKVIPGMNAQEFQWVGRQVVVLLVVHHLLLEYVAESLQCTLLKDAVRVLHLYITAHVHSSKFELISQIAFLCYLHCPHGLEYERWPSVPKEQLQNNTCITSIYNYTCRVIYLADVYIPEC